MANQQPSFNLSHNQPLIGIPFTENGKEVIRCFSEEELADRAVSEESADTRTPVRGVRAALPSAIVQSLRSAGRLEGGNEDGPDSTR
jgi:hypothetical protein